VERGLLALTFWSLTIGHGSPRRRYSRWLSASALPLPPTRWFDPVILHALPIHDPDRLVLVDWNGDQVGSGFGSWNLMSYPICRDLQQQTRFFDGVLCRAEIGSPSHSSLA
jgi:hypothetical protein